MTVATAPKFKGKARYATVMQALEEAGPLFFVDIMSELGSRDGRDVTIQLDELRQKGRLVRDGDGRYLLGSAVPGTTGLHGPQREDPNAHTGTT